MDPITFDIWFPSAPSGRSYPFVNQTPSKYLRLYGHQDWPYHSTPVTGTDGTVGRDVLAKLVAEPETVTLARWWFAQGCSS